MQYDFSAIPESEVPRAAVPRWQHALDTYASEINKVYDTWSQFANADLDFRPHPKSMTVREVLKHQLLSERRFFGEFLQGRGTARGRGAAHGGIRGGVLVPPGRTGTPAPGISGAPGRGLVAHRHSVLRCGAPAHLDFLAADSAHRTPPHPVDGLSETAGQAGARDLRTYRGRTVGRR